MISKTLTVLWVSCVRLYSINFDPESARATTCYCTIIESECHQYRAQATTPDEHQLSYQQYISSR